MNVPLSIQVKKDGELRFDWKFRLYEPGLWLLDFGRSGSERMAWIEEVQINGKQARLREATTVSLERQQARQAGHLAIQRVLEANRGWLLPSLDSRNSKRIPACDDSEHTGWNPGPC